MSDTEIFQDAFRRHIAVAEKSLDAIVGDVAKAADILFESLHGGHKLFACGNGGSAADAQHFAAEFVCKYKENRNPLPVIALTVDTSVLTAIGNDFGFENVFSRQLEALGATGDVLVAITTSGKSPNVLRAINAAKEKNMKVIVLTGARGSELKNSADAAIVVPLDETARIQETHGLIIHAWCEYLDKKLFNV